MDCLPYCPHTHPSIHPPSCPPTHGSFTYLHLPIQPPPTLPPTNTPIHSSICPPTHPTIHPPTHPPNHPSTHPPIHPPTHPPIYSLHLPSELLLGARHCHKHQQSVTNSLREVCPHGDLTPLRFYACPGQVRPSVNSVFFQKLLPPILLQPGLTSREGGSESQPSKKPAPHPRQAIRPFISTALPEICVYTKSQKFLQG